MNIFKVIGLVISILFVVFYIRKNLHLTIVSLIGSLIVIMFNGMDPFYALSDVFLPAISDFATSWFFQFISSAIFGKIIEDSGAAVKIASVMLKLLGRKSAILIVMLIGCVLSYSGVGTFTIAFTIYPIAIALFKDADIPKSLIVATVMVCPVTICMAMLPGAPSMQNLIPTHYFGTTIYSAPRIGLICSVLMFISAYVYLSLQVKKYRKNKIHFLTGEDEDIKDVDALAREDLPSTVFSFIPMVVVFVTIPMLQFVLKLDTVYSVVCSLLLSVIVCCILFHKRFSIIKSINQGTVDGVVALISTSSIMGFGAIVSASPAYGIIVSFLSKISLSPLFSAILGINVIAAITGSSAGGLNIYLSSMSNSLIASGINVSVLHRVVCIASSGFDAMPHASGIVLCNQIARTSQKDTYIHVFFVCALFPFLFSLLAAVLGYIGVV